MPPHPGQALISGHRHMSLMLAGGHVPCMALGLRLESPAQRMQRAEHNCRTKTGRHTCSQRVASTRCLLNNGTGIQQQDATPRSRRFQPFAPQTAVQQALANFRLQSQTAHGTLIIRPLTQDWLQSTADLLAVSFGESMGYLPPYRHFLRKHIQRYLTDHIALVPKTLILIALLMPDSLSSACDSDDMQNGDMTCEWASLIGSVELSLSPTTRSRYLTLNPPEEHGYLSNMAVASNYRRRGYGKLLLEAAESACSLSGRRDLCLHLRFQDHAASVLYKQAGYVEEKRDNPLIFLLGQDRRYLLRKTLLP